ncbi:MAG: c-type cytochrome [Anaerolineales bacterium]
MSLVRKVVAHKLGQFALVLIGAYLLFRLGVPWFSGLLTGQSAPVPAHLLWTIYMPIVLLVMLLFVSANEESWREFQRPLRELIVEQDRAAVIWTRRVFSVGLPLLAGLFAYLQVRPEVSAPPELRSVHPAPPSRLTLDGESIDLRTAVSPFRDSAGDPDPAALAEGKAIYGQYCVLCHGDNLAGNGLFAGRLRPRPADFTDPGTIAQLQESYLFWRIATGGPGLPPEGKGWNSAMPAWEGTLHADQIWKVILYLYEATGQQPRALSE